MTGKEEMDVRKLEHIKYDSPQRLEVEIRSGYANANIEADEVILDHIYGRLFLKLAGVVVLVANCGDWLFVKLVKPSDKS
jgi:hypothetical protein